MYVIRKESLEGLFKIIIIEVILSEKRYLPRKKRSVLLTVFFCIWLSHMFFNIWVLNSIKKYFNFNIMHIWNTWVKIFNVYIMMSAYNPVNKSVKFFKSGSWSCHSRFKELKFHVVKIMRNGGSRDLVGKLFQLWQSGFF